MKMISANKLNRLWRNGVVAEMVAKTKVLKTIEEISANTSAENVAGATAVKELSNKLTQVRTYVGEDGKLHSVDGTGADTVLNFSNTLTDPFRIICTTNALCYPSIPTGGHNIRLTVTSMNSDKIPSIYGSSQIDFSTTTATKIGNLQKAIMDIEAKEYKYLIIRYGSSNNSSFTTKIEWI